MSNILDDVLESISHSTECFDVNLKDVNQYGVYGNTPLKVAAVRGDAEAIHILLAAGADVNAIVEDDCTALHHAAGSNHLEIVRLLLDSGSVQNIPNKFGRTPLDDARLFGHLETVKLLEAHK